MLLWPFKARDTEATETRASLATSLIVTAKNVSRRPDAEPAISAAECKRFHG
jgi:hypothetical protein